MHPPLHVHKHLHCKVAIADLVNCHADNSLAKFWGACNEQKWALDACLREEKAIKRALNFEKAKRERERLRQKLDEAQAPQGGAALSEAA
ncbi:hypothetical protein WJX81_008369 [Elliptochloris bilobata]|uniref:COX assembly mitochondrial protein n=1 Tax=Elliptochloris bilobata TaxID=381761 RepID=A0AAW1RPE4_9CHLO